MSYTARLCLVGWAAPRGVAHVVCRGYLGSYPPQYLSLDRNLVNGDKVARSSYFLARCDGGRGGRTWIKPRVCLASPSCL